MQRRIKIGEIIKQSEGSILHVMEPAHHIQWVELYVGENFRVRVALTPGYTKVNSTLTLVLEAVESITQRGMEQCNIHRLWENTRFVCNKHQELL
jgi:desulfoferrodoxin-like iron-binding protein